FKHSVESVRGFDALRTAFPAGTLAPTTILVESENCPVTPAQIALARQKLRAVDGVAGVAPPIQTSRSGSIGSLNLVLKGDPNSKSGLDVVPRMRDAVANMPAGTTVLVGGSSAINYDIDNANNHDLELIAPLALLVMAIILAILLQSLVAPLLLLASVVLSFACTLGVSILFIRYVL